MLVHLFHIPLNQKSPIASFERISVNLLSLCDLQALTEENGKRSHVRNNRDLWYSEPDQQMMKSQN